MTASMARKIATRQSDKNKLNIIRIKKRTEGDFISFPLNSTVLPLTLKNIIKPMISIVKAVKIKASDSDINLPPFFSFRLINLTNS